MTASEKGRLAPTPSGKMHVGNARTALIAWLSARAQGGRIILRIEDLDPDRVAPGATLDLQRDLLALGLEWDEGPDPAGGDRGPAGPYRQSERAALYAAALSRLNDAGRVFACSCSRKDIARAAQAPHPAAGDGAEGRYPGTCRDKPPGQATREAATHGRRPCLRFRADGRTYPFVDAVAGPRTGQADDFVLRRADGVFAYHLAVVVDDAAMAVTQVVRGDDLLAVTPDQLALIDALGLTPPRYAHVPLVLDAAGERMAKRNRPTPVAALFARGVSPQQLIGRLAHAAGLKDDPGPCHPSALVSGFDWARLRREPVTWSS